MLTKWQQVKWTMFWFIIGLINFIYYRAIALFSNRNAARTWFWETLCVKKKKHLDGEKVLGGDRPNTDGSHYCSQLRAVRMPHWQCHRNVLYRNQKFTNPVVFVAKIHLKYHVVDSTRAASAAGQFIWQSILILYNRKQSQTIANVFSLNLILWK